MRENRLINTLKEIGLTDNEARAYFASLSLGPSTVARIATAAELKRTTVYDIVGSLKQKGLMSIEVRGFKNLYVPEPPERLEDVLEARKDLVRRSMPEFSALYNLKGGESTLKYYEGLESVKSLYEDVLEDLRPGEEYLAFSDMQRWYDLDPKFFERFIEKRTKLGLKVRLLLQNSPKAEEMKKSSLNYGAEVKILPGKASLKTNLIITPRIAVIHQLIPPILGIAIENASVIQMHREMFEVIWNSLPE